MINREIHSTTTFKLPPGVPLATVDENKDVEYEAVCTIIEGIVHPRGHAILVRRHGGHNAHVMSFLGWRKVGGDLVPSKLYLIRPVVPGTQMIDMYTEVPVYSIQRLSVLLSMDQTRAVVEKVLRMPEPDNVLVEYANQQMVPVVVPTRLFGDIVFHPVYEWFVGTADWNSKKVRLTFHVEHANMLADLLKTAETLWEDQAGWERRVQDLAVSELLSLKNEVWLHEGEPEMSLEEFKAKMILESISFKNNGLFEFWFEDAEVFGDHAIRATGNLVDGLTEVHLEG